MFCKNCGNRIPDNAKFCRKCGAAVPQFPGRTGMPSSTQEEQGGQRNIKLPAVGLKVRMIAGGAVAVLLLIVAVIVGVNFAGRGKTPQEEGHYADESKASAEEKEQEEVRYIDEGKAAAEKKEQEEGRYIDESKTAAEEKKQDQDHDVTALKASSEIVLEGRYENLKSITMSPGEDGAVEAILYKEDASFPVLESLECGAVFKVSDSGDKDYFDEKDFPQLKNVTMKMVNGYIDEDVMMTFLLFRDMYAAGQLQNFQVENSYTIEELYGTWTNEGQTFTLTFEKDGVLRVADANNIIGVDVLKYKEVNDNTLSLSADQGGLFGMISISMKYQLFGKQLFVEISGQEFALTRK